MNAQARRNRKVKIAKIIEREIGPDKEFTVYTVHEIWGRLWSRLPSIKELSKVLPTNPALESTRNNMQDPLIYTWDGKKDLYCYTLDTPEKMAEFKRLRKLKEGS